MLVVDLNVPINALCLEYIFYKIIADNLTLPGFHPCLSLYVDFYQKPTIVDPTHSPS